MRVRSAQTLVFTRQGSEIVAFNFLSGNSFTCSPDLLGVLTSLEDWTEREAISRVVQGAPDDALPSVIETLAGVDALVEEGSDLAAAEDELKASWKWGLPAALFHFSLRDRCIMSIEEGEEAQRLRIQETPQPPLYLSNDSEGAIRLPSSLGDNDLLQLMARRRTIRLATATPIPIGALSDCLFAGMGITGSTENCVGTLPLGMTPSGGARNPFEAYVYARSVDGLDPGFYHYAAIDHTLARLTANELPLPSELLGGQEWANEMPCLVFLCARFERTMWKYDDANAYRVVLIEAGHVGQNFMLAATRLGLSACPTAALNHSRIEQCLTIEARVTHAPVYALTLGYPAPDG